MEGMDRPDAEVLSAADIVPAGNLITPPPDQFTHEVTKAQAYYYAGPAKGRPADGRFTAGTKVVLMGRGAGRWCRVVDGRGLYVTTAFSGLKPMP